MTDSSAPGESPERNQVTAPDRAMRVFPPVAPRRRMLSKSDFVLARSCEAKLYFRENGYPDSRADDPYLRLLAQGGYMVEALAKARFPDGIALEYGRDPLTDFARTMEYLARDSVTLFEATLIAGRRQARVDILHKQGDQIHLIEVKSKSIDGAAHADSLATGGKGLLRSARAPFRIRSEWEEKLEDITYQVLLLEELLPDVSVHPSFILVDKSKRAQLDYVPAFFELVWRERRNGERHLQTARFRGTPADLAALDLLAQVEVREEVDLLRDDVRDAALLYESHLDASLSEFAAVPGAHCRDCEFRHDEPVHPNGFAECWGPLADATPHALELYSIGTVKNQDGTPLIETLFRDGRASLFDVPVSSLTTTNGAVGAKAARQRRQIECTRRGELFVSPDLPAALGALQYPVHFIDFEVSSLALPYHSGMAPYGSVAFQWSCHTVERPGADPVHREWLNTVDLWPNRQFAESLREAIGDSGSVLTWSKFENTTIRRIAGELLQRHPDAEPLVRWLEGIESRTVDMERWAANDFYHPGMGGRTSIKVVMDALWKADAALRGECERWSGITCDADHDPYSALPALEIAGQLQDVREGTGAITAYEHMMYGSGRDDAEARKQWCELLQRYCQLDTLSMVLIFRYLRRVTSVESGRSVRRA